MEISYVNALSDNYMYILKCKVSGQLAVIDPVEPKKLMSFIEDRSKLEFVLTTHHHYDHAGGNDEISKLVPNIIICGGDKRVNAVQKLVSRGDVIEIGNLTVTCLFTPCHTSGHICYFVEAKNSNEPPAVFTGDTLFIGGCGRFFEGNGQQMYDALINILGKLPSHTRVYCGHEYTHKNMKFAATVEPDNQAIVEKLNWASKQKQTIPSTIEEEFKTNVFMRVGEDAVQRKLGSSDPVVVMDKLRRAKDNF